MAELHILFSADVPENAVWNEFGDLEVPGGKEIAQFIVEALVRLGMQCTDIMQRDYYGWDFRVRVNGEEITAVLQHIDEWLLVLPSKRTLIRAIIGKRSDDEHWDIAQKIKQILLSDRRFSNVRILTADESPY